MAIFRTDLVPAKAREAERTTFSTRNISLARFCSEIRSTSRAEWSISSRRAISRLQRGSISCKLLATRWSRTGSIFFALCRISDASIEDNFSPMSKLLPCADYFRRRGALYVPCTRPTEHRAASSTTCHTLRLPRKAPRSLQLVSSSFLLEPGCFSSLRRSHRQTLLWHSLQRRARCLYFWTVGFSATPLWIPSRVWWSFCERPKST
mmetsp:Transcript_10909/g.29242  ORF Transcript_10909/g.29242 Transcript_10909/m.29242 type:complete len:207 (+) Transcript_10909:216-836(+)